MFKRGERVAYSGRAGRVRGVVSPSVSGPRLEALEIEHTGGAKGSVFVPLHRVPEAVKPISKHEAEHMDATIAPVATTRQNRMARIRAAHAAKQSLWGSMGAHAKARNRAA